MPDTTEQQGTATPAATPAPEQTPAAAEQTPAASQEPSWLKGRLDQAKTAAQRELLQSLGIEKPEDLKSALAKLKTLEDEKLSAEERTTKRLAELEPKATRVEQLEATVKQYADRELSGLSELQRSAVAALAGNDPSRVLGAIEALKPTWTNAAPPAAEPPKPASTTAATPPPAPAGTTSQVDHKAEFARLRKDNPFEAPRYFAEHSKHILG